MIATDAGRSLTQDSFTNINLDNFWSPLLESLHQGVVIVTVDRHIVYFNSKAKLLYSTLLEPDEDALLPIAVAHGCDQLAQELASGTQSLVIEQTGHKGQQIRSRLCWLQTDVVATDVSARYTDQSRCNFYNAAQSANRVYILVLVEDCDETLQESLRIEQKRYNLTNRETEIWRLLRQEYTYQEITKILHISMNTVKTHIKNIHTKRRAKSLEQSTFWYSR